MCSAGLYALTFCDQGLAKVVLVKSWFRVAIGLPLRLYNGINTPSGAILTGCMRGLVSGDSTLGYLSTYFGNFFSKCASTSSCSSSSGLCGISTLQSLIRVQHSCLTLYP